MFGISFGTTTQSTIAGPSQANASRSAAVRVPGCLTLKPCAPHGASQRGKVGVGKLDGLPEREDSDAFGFQRNQSERRVIENYDFHRQFVMNRSHELAHQHIEAAVAGEHNHLLGAIERLNAVGLAEGGPNGRIVE